MIRGGHRVPHKRLLAKEPRVIHPHTKGDGLMEINTSDDC